MAASRKSPPSDDGSALVAGIEARLADILAVDRRATVALSGGLDSVVLLDCLVRLRERLAFQLDAIHVDHGLSSRSGEWARFCAALCDAHGIALTTARVQVAGRQGEGLEAAARRARYGAFRRHVVGLLVLGHHLDDQAETVLLQLLRGAGPRGAAAMPSLREAGADGQARLTLARPLLDVPRSRLEAYARARGLSWVDDESNADTALDRNYLRARVMPLLEDRFPGYRRALGRSAALFQESSHLLDELAALDARDTVRGDALQLEALRALSEPRARNLLRWFLRDCGMAAPPARRLTEATRQLRQARADRHVRLALRDAELACDAGWLRLRPRMPRHDASVPWQGEAALTAPGGLGEVVFHRTRGGGIAVRSLADRQVELRLRRGGERIRPDCRRPRRTLKNLLQEYRIDPWRRARLPLLFCDDHLVWVPGIGVDCTWQAGPGEASITPEWRLRPPQAGAGPGRSLQSRQD